MKIFDFYFSRVSEFQSFRVSVDLADSVTCKYSKKITRRNIEKHRETQRGMNFGVSGFRAFGLSGELGSLRRLEDG